MLKRGQLEYLLTLVPEVTDHKELRLAIQKELNQYERSSDTDKFMLFMERACWYSSGRYQFSYQYGEVTVQSRLSHLNVGGIRSKAELVELIEKFGLPELRFCDYCGAPMEDGFTDEDEYLCCEEEFIQKMNSLYGAGNWRAEPSGQADHCYEYQKDGKWFPSDWYLTEWY